MRYLCLVHIDGAAIGALSAAEDKDLTRRSLAYDEELARTGTFVAASALAGPETAKIVRARGAAVSVSDGPFAETKEHLGGFILIEAANMDEAVAIASRIPVGQYGSIEVRPSAPMDVD